MISMEYKAQTFKTIENASMLFVCSGVWPLYFVYGMCLGTPTVLISQIRKEANSTAAVSTEMASWLTAVFGYAAIPWVVIISILTNRYGRKKPLFFSVICILFSFIIFYYSTNLAIIMIIESIQGLLPACNFAISSLIVTEYTSPCYRGIFLTIKQASFFWGMWVANAIGTFFHWRNIPLCSLMCTFYSFISILFWPESPYWLASVGRFDECAKAHRWLKGSSEKSEEELKSFLNHQTERYKNKVKQTNRQTKSLKQITKVMTTKEFYKPNLLGFLVIFLIHISGKTVCSLYALDIFIKISGEDAAYTGMLILDGITVISIYISCGLAKILKRRIMLISATSVTIFFLFTMSVYLYLVKLEMFGENKYITLLLLSAYSLAACCGPIVLSPCILPELYPLKFRSASVCLLALVSKFIIATLMKISPYIFQSCGMHGTFLFYGSFCSICLILVYIYLPETKDKTLQEIQNAINGRDLDVGKKKKPRELIPLTQESHQIS